MNDVTIEAMTTTEFSERSGLNYATIRRWIVRHQLTVPPYTVRFDGKRMILPGFVQWLKDTGRWNGSLKPPRDQTQEGRIPMARRPTSDWKYVHELRMAVKAGFLTAQQFQAMIGAPGADPTEAADDEPRQIFD